MPGVSKISPRHLSNYSPSLASGLDILALRDLINKKDTQEDFFSGYALTSISYLGVVLCEQAYFSKLPPRKR